MDNKKNIDEDIVRKSLRKNSLLITLALILILNGIFFFLVNIKAFGLSLKTHWSISVIITGLSFIVSDLIIYKKIRSVFLLSALAISFLGVIFLLFSMNIFNISFKRFVMIFWPILLVIFGAILLAIYEAQKISKDDFPYMEEDSTEDNF